MISISTKIVLAVNFFVKGMKEWFLKLSKYIISSINSSINSNINSNIKLQSNNFRNLFENNIKQTHFNINNFYHVMHMTFKTSLYLCKDFEAKYKNLIKNLDEESINQVNTIIARIQRVSESKTEKIDIFTEKEKVELDNIRKKLRNNIIKLNEECFVWQNYFLPVSYFSPSVFYFKHQIEDLNNIDKLKNKNILDVGGFIGDSAIVLSKYTDKTIHSFEPVKTNFDLMLKTIDMNNCKNIVPHNFALGNKEEIHCISCSTSSSTFVGDFKTSTNIEKVVLTTLDNFIKENPMEIGLIKVDIEGFEQQFLQGAKETIFNQKPTLLISIYHSFEDFFEIKPMLESWDLGYKFKIRRPIDGQIHSETLLLAEIDD